MLYIFFITTLITKLALSESARLGLSLKLNSVALVPTGSIPFLWFVVRVSGYRSRDHGFDSRRYQIF
jgi:hypothetical protein